MNIAKRIANGCHNEDHLTTKDGRGPVSKSRRRRVRYINRAARRIEAREHFKTFNA